MAYIGPEPNPGQNREVDDISSGFNGGTASFTLQVNGQNVSPGSANAIIVSLGGVIQNPGTDYTVAASTITFTTNPASGLDFFGLVLGQGIDTEGTADGSITLSKFVNGTASNDGKFLRANNGAIPSFESLPAGGKIGQVLQTTKTDTFSLNASSYTDITGMSVAITPAATTSKVLILVDLKVGAEHGDSDFFMQLVRGSTAIYNGDTSGVRTSAFFGLSKFDTDNALGESTMRQVSATFLDSPSTTSATTYKIQMQNKGGRVNFINRQGLDSNAINIPRAASSITVMEVLA